MTKTMPIIDVRKVLTRMPERFNRDSDLDTVVVTRRGRPVLALMPWDFYETLVETLEILSDPDLMKQLRKGIREMKQGKGLDWNRAKSGLPR